MVYPSYMNYDFNYNTFSCTVYNMVGIILIQFLVHMAGWQGFSLFFFFFFGCGKTKNPIEYCSENPSLILFSCGKCDRVVMQQRGATVCLKQNSIMIQAFKLGFFFFFLYLKRWIWTTKTLWSYLILKKHCQWSHSLWKSHLIEKFQNDQLGQLVLLLLFL